MTLQKWAPFYGFDRFLDDVNRAVDGQFRSLNGTNRGYSFAVDVREDEKELRVTAELPGIRSEDMNVRVEDNVLTISAERRFEDEENRDSYHRIERFYGSYERTFTLPSYVDSGKIKAEYKDGILTLHLPKKPETQPRRIKVKTAE